MDRFPTNKTDKLQWCIIRNYFMPLCKLLCYFLTLHRPSLTLYFSWQSKTENAELSDIHSASLSHHSTHFFHQTFVLTHVFISSHTSRFDTYRCFQHTHEYKTLQIHIELNQVRKNKTYSLWYAQCPGGDSCDRPAHTCAGQLAHAYMCTLTAVDASPRALSLLGDTNIYIYEEMVMRNGTIMKN